MNEYTLEWTIQWDGDGPLDVVERVLEMLLDPEHTATIFTVTGEGGKVWEVDASARTVECIWGGAMTEGMAI